MISWGDLNARARGLGTHLLGRARLEHLAATRDLAALADRLAAEGLAPSAPDGSLATALELAVRRDASRRLGTLARWAGRRTTTLAVIFEDEERRSLRAILRGALHGAPAAARLAGLLPTPSLPERALETLAALATAGEIAALLVAWRNPYGSAILDEARQTQPDPLRLDTIVNRTFAARALSAARRARRLRAYGRRVIDIENVAAALVVAAHARDTPPAQAFIEGGDLVTRKAFLAAANAGSAARSLAESLAGTPYAAALSRHAADPEGPLLAAHLAEVGRERRLDPVGPAPLFEYALRLRAESLDLRRIIWGTGLAAPVTMIAHALVTPP